jgi:hypothetical protein
MEIEAEVKEAEELTVEDEEEEIPKVIIERKPKIKRLNEQDRMGIVARYLRTGESPDGYKVTEDPPGVFHVKTVRKITKQDELRQQKLRLEKKIEKLDNELKALGDDKVDIEQKPKKKPKKVKIEEPEIKVEPKIEIKDEPQIENKVEEIIINDEEESNKASANEVSDKIEEQPKVQAPKFKPTSRVNSRRSLYNSIMSKSVKKIPQRSKFRYVEV